MLFYKGAKVFHISDTEKYLKVEFNGQMDLPTITRAINATMDRPDYPHRNDIWVLEGSDLALQFENLAQITEMIKGRYPVNATRTKTALVASPGFNASIAQLWIESAQVLPQEIKMFSGLKPAEDWVNESPVA